MKPLLVLLSLLALPGTTVAEVDEAALRTQVQALLREEFPEAELQAVAGGFVFTHKTRTFTIYRTNKVGEWQDPMTVTGPDRGGFMVEFRITPGRWGGALFVPYAGTEDLHVFQESVVVRNSKDLSRHIRAEILNPPMKGHPELRDRLMRLFREFDGSPER